MEEIWLPLIGYESLYNVSNLGNIKALHKIVYRGCSPSGERHLKSYLKEKILKPGFKAASLKYRFFFACNNGARKSIQVHRAVALAFIPNPENKPCINHIDGDPGNNHISNLEWCTQKENIRHSINRGEFQIKHKRVKNINGELMSISEAARRHGVTPKTIWNWVTGLHPNKSEYKYA